MKQWVGRIIVLAAAAVLGYFIWNYFFPSPEKVIRNRLNELAKLVSLSGNETEVAAFQNSNKIASYFSDDIEIRIDTPSFQHSLSGRQELFQAAMFSRLQAGGFNVQFLDIVVSFPPSKQLAEVSLTMKGRIPTDRDMMVQECKFTLKKVGRTWLIRKIETVRTLSGARTVLVGA